MNQLHPGARWIFRLNTYWLFFFLGVFIFLPARKTLINALGRQLPATIIAAAVVILFIVACAEIYARLAYSRWFFELTNRGLKLEHGIIWKKYTTIPYERVQNVNINRGILARIFGFSTIDIETAGQSGFVRYGFGRKRYKSEGHIPAVSIEDAEKIRAFVMKRIGKESGV